MTVLLGPLPCARASSESQELRETVTIGMDGSVHRCPDVAIARAFDYTTGAGASGEPNRLNVAPVSQLAPGARASFHVGSKTT